MLLGRNYNHMTRDTQLVMNIWTSCTGKSFNFQKELNLTNTRLWQGSWADEAQRWDREARVAYEPSRIKKIEQNGRHTSAILTVCLQHQQVTGEYLKLSARHQMHPSPQRCPVIFQAGQSKAGLNFAAKRAEAIYIRALVPSQAAH
jgi:alkanesulfonate monooxygenase SsuD/methylene tetrahydromethanopterin reductase-like flavin-dependent oxidoreductase (luciferase family)